MQQITGPDAALAALHHPSLVVPPLPSGSSGPASALGTGLAPGRPGIGWLRASVGRFSNGPVHARRRALSVAVLDAVPPGVLRPAAGPEHPVAILVRAMGVDVPVLDPVRDVAQAYHPGTGDPGRADAAVEHLVAVFGGTADEATAARIGVLVQACEPTAALVERARHRPVDVVLRDDPPVPATLRQALADVTVGGVTLAAGEVVRIALSGDLAFGAGPRRCPGRAHALALAGAPT